jgi:fructose-1,6-bisphosphatase/inositol monophosphatase family enzyme
MTQSPLSGPAGSARTPKTHAEKEAIRAKLRRVGLGCIIVGLVMVAVGLLDLMIGDGRSRMWMILAGIPLAAVGGRMLQLSNTQPRR